MAQVFRPALAAAAATSLALFLPFGPVLAGPIADKAAEVEQLLEASDHMGALTAARDLTAEAWDAMPALGFTNVELSTEPSVGYGIFNPRESNKFKTGEAVILYTEPVGYGYGQPKPDLYSINFGVDLQLLTESGESLGEVKDIAKIDYLSRNKMRECNATVTFNLGGIKPGKYLLKVTIRDLNSTKSGQFDQAIEIVE